MLAFATMTAVISAAIVATPAHADRIKDIAHFGGVRSNSLTGYGIVVGLSGTGDDNLEYTVQSMRSAAARLGVTLPPGVAPGLKNAAAVIVTAELPAFAKPGQRIDVTVAALGKAKSLRGGTLLLSPLQGADGEVYALAQGNLAVGGFGAEGRDGSKLVVNTPSSGRVPNGASVERAVANPFGAGDTLTLDLVDADFTTARAVAAAISASGAPATALDAMTISIPAPADTAARIALASRIERLDVAVDAPPARVIVNARTGTVVIGAGVRVLPTAIAHGNLTVRVTETTNGQPARARIVRQDGRRAQVAGRRQRDPGAHGAVRAGRRARRHRPRGECAGGGTGGPRGDPRGTQGGGCAARRAGGDMSVFSALAAVPLTSAASVRESAPGGDNKVAADFEALFVTQLLHAAHAAKLADDPLAGDDTSFRDLQDRTLAEALVRQSPLGVAKLLAAKR